MESLAGLFAPIRFASMILLSATSKMIYASANVIKTSEKTTVFCKYFYG
jgi:hypothetical protein